MNLPSLARTAASDEARAGAVLHSHPSSCGVSAAR
jgi:hypothetical protein